MAPLVAHVVFTQTIVIVVRVTVSYRAIELELPAVWLGIAIRWYGFPRLLSSQPSDPRAQPAGSASRDPCRRVPCARWVPALRACNPLPSLPRLRGREGRGLRPLGRDDATGGRVTLRKRHDLDAKLIQKHHEMSGASHQMIYFIR